MSGLCEGVEGVGGDLSNVCIIYTVCERIPAEESCLHRL